MNSGKDLGLLGRGGPELSHLHNGDKDPCLSGMLTKTTRNSRDSINSAQA